MDDLATLATIAARRRSVRAFRPDPVPRVLVEAALGVALATPSNCNTQPWQVHVVSGHVLETLRAALVETSGHGGATVSDIPPAPRYSGVFHERQVDAAMRLFAAQGVDRHDHVARRDSFLRNFRFFDAPHAAFVLLPDWGGAREAADCGQFVQSFVLALTAAGIGSCIQGSLGANAPLVREMLGIASGKLLLGISFGYADNDDPTAAVRPGRSAIAELVRFHDAAITPVA